MIVLTPGPAHTLVQTFSDAKVVSVLNEVKFQVAARSLQRIEFIGIRAVVDNDEALHLS